MSATFDVANSERILAICHLYFLPADARKQFDPGLETDTLALWIIRPCKLRNEVPASHGLMPVRQGIGSGP